MTATGAEQESETGRANVHTEPRSAAASDDVASRDDPNGCDLDSPVEFVSKASSFRAKTITLLIFGLLPVAIVAVAATAGYFRGALVRNGANQVASVESVEAAKDIAASMLTYTPDDAQTSLAAAGERMTGALRESYTRLAAEKVLPAAKQRRISSLATVQAAASITASAREAVVLLFINQSVSVGDVPPTDSATTVRMTLHHEAGEWMASEFTPE